MDFFKDTWSVLDEYFKSNYFLTKHHLDSYNDFILNKLPNTIRVLNPFIIIKNQDNGTTTHEINIYIGGINGDEIFINKPTIIENGEQKLMYPNEARLKDMTYKAEIFANITIKYITKKGSKEIVDEKIFNNIKIGSIPIMLHSCICVLNKQPPQILHEMGECIYDQGGYFIMDGKEKVIVAQERITTNRIFINISKDPKYSYEGLIRCTSEENPLFPKTINIYVYADKNFKKPYEEDEDEKDKSIETETDKSINEINKYPNSIVISSPNITTKIPLFVLFRALGIESDKDILETILIDLDAKSNKVMLDFLRHSVLHGSSIMTQDAALKYLANFVEYKNIDKLKHVIINDLFPNVGNEFKNKALFLGHIINKLIKVCLAVTKESDRDSYLFKRVDISGFLVANLFRDYYNQFRQTVRNNVDRQYLYGPWKTLSDITNLINKGNLSYIFQQQIVEDGMRKSLKGSWGVNMVEEQQDMDDIKEGLVQDLSRISYMGFISHLRRVNTPMDPTSKIVGPHRLHPSQWGIMCPCESPDGGSIGLSKNFAIMCTVSFDSNPTSILECLKENGMTLLTDIDIRSVGINTKILINSNWVGLHDDPPSIYKLLKLLKRNALINIYTSISWNIIHNEINILTEAGRCCRPLYVVYNEKLVIEKYIDKVKKSQMTWNQLTTGSTLKNVDVFTSKYINPSTVLSKDKDIISQLENNQSAIEFIDAEEANTSYIAMDNTYLGKKKLYTHCEIHPSTIFGILSHQIPLANHNQAPRNIFSGAQGKQALGCYATNFNNRIDTMAYVLNYPQKCLVNTRFCEYLNLNRVPNGENLIVAMMTYTGYNMEDAIIINEGSIKRGVFNVTYFKNMISREEENKNSNEKITFNNPMSLIEENKSLNELKWANYKKLDENGFPIINSYISEGDAILGRTKITTELAEDDNIQNNIFGNKIKKEIYHDRSIVADKTVSGIVDKVYIYVDDENLKTCKIRFRKTRMPEPGDKCCCYDEDTEILTLTGWKFFKDLSKDDKVATIVNDTLVYQNSTEIQSYDVDEKLYQLENNQVKLRVTNNHRMYVRTRTNLEYKIKESQDIFGKQTFYKKNVNNWNPDYTNVPDELLMDNGKVIGFMIDGYTDDTGVEYNDLILDIDSWLIFFGIWIAEGCILRQDYITISNKQIIKDVLEKICKTLNFQINKYKKTDTDTDTWVITNIILIKYMYQLNVNGSNKYLPDWVWFLNRKQCKILINGILLGRYYTTSTKLADQFQQLCLHAGYSSNKLLEENYQIQKNESITNVNYWILNVIDKQNEPIVNKNNLEDSWVDYKGKVWCCTVPLGDGVVYVRKKGYVVWCGQSRHAQKGVIGMVIKQENMPFTKDGIIPDIIINPHGLPSRMTLGHLLETLLGKVSCCNGATIDGTPFNNNDYSKLYLMMEKEFNLERHGNEIMYNGLTGEQIETEIYIGPTYYERLKHMVADKINYRQVNIRTIYNNKEAVILKDAPVSAMTRQPTKGRGNNGGLRIGEMEKDSILSHGMTAFLKESLMERSDKYDFYIDNENNSILNTDISKAFDISKVETPFAFKQLVHELNTLSIKPILYTTSDIEEEVYEYHEND